MTELVKEKWNYNIRERVFSVAITPDEVLWKFETIGLWNSGCLIFELPIPLNTILTYQFLGKQVNSLLPIIYLM
ncbi:MAG: hypothetical protein QME42_04620 [bacterium]|nr:hypothetical protein [bacterium]